MGTFLLRLEPPRGDGPRLAVKDLLDVVGTPTTAASRPVAARARPARSDAEAVRRARVAGARLVGKTNLHELAFGGTGVNEFTGTPVNPLDPSRIPGGSSSGSAVAVATGEADVAIGTDTGGSIRTPSVCCGTVGLKTTLGRIPTTGVLPLAPSFDVVGPMAATVTGVVVGMALLEAGFVPAGDGRVPVGRIRLAGADPDLERCVDRALASAELPVHEPSSADDPLAAVEQGWDGAAEAGATVVFGEAWRIHGHLFERHAGDLTASVRERFATARTIGDAVLLEALERRRPWRAIVDAALVETPVLALVGLVGEPSLLGGPDVDTRRSNVPVNLAGHPAIVLPVRRPGRLPGSIQLVGAHGAEELLCAVAARIESAVAP